MCKVDVDRGVLFVKSAGNFGATLTESITNPGCGYNVLTVGNLDDKNDPEDTIKWVVNTDSSRGPSSEVGGSLSVFTAGRIKPEVVAPGTNIFSHNNADSFSVLSQFDGTAITGTSFAAPPPSIGA